jgi:hypothetical protein
VPKAVLDKDGLAGYRAHVQRSIGVICPALTGATFAWVIFFGGFRLMDDGPEMAAWLPSFRDLSLLWQLTVFVGLVLTVFRTIPPFWAGTVAVFVSSSLTFAYSMGEHIARIYAWERPPPTVTGMMISSLPVTALLTAIAGIFWVPPILLSSHRHRTLNHGFKEIKGNA